MKFTLTLIAIALVAVFSMNTSLDAKSKMSRALPPSIQSTNSAHAAALYIAYEINGSVQTDSVKVSDSFRAMQVKKLKDKLINAIPEKHRDSEEGAAALNVAYRLYATSQGSESQRVQDVHKITTIGQLANKLLQ